MNDLVYAVKRSKLSAYAEDTQIFFPDSKSEVINADLANVDWWYEENGMKRNTSKYQAIVMGRIQTMPKFYCENTTIPNTEELEMVRVRVDDKIKFEKHIESICRKVSQQVVVLKGQMNQKIDIFFFVALPSPNTKKNHPKWELGKDFCSQAFIER